MARKPTGKPVGPPKKKIDWQRFEDHCSFQCTQQEIASKLNVDIKTLVKHVEEHYGEKYSVIYKKFSAAGLGSLRSYQFHQAKTNASMAIFLGKVLLKQKEETNKEEIRDVLIELIKAGQLDELKKGLAQEGNSTFPHLMKV